MSGILPNIVHKVKKIPGRSTGTWEQKRCKKRFFLFGPCPCKIGFKKLFVRYSNGDIFSFFYWGCEKKGGIDGEKYIFLTPVFSLSTPSTHYHAGKQHFFGIVLSSTVCTNQPSTVQYMLHCFCSFMETSLKKVWILLGFLQNFDRCLSDRIMQKIQHVQCTYMQISKTLFHLAYQICLQSKISPTNPISFFPVITAVS